MPKNNVRSQADIEETRRRLLSSLRRYNVSVDVLSKLKKDQLAVLCGVIGISAPSTKKSSVLIEDILRFKNGTFTDPVYKYVKAVTEYEINNTILLLEEIALRYNKANGIEFSPYSVSIYDELPFDFDVSEDELSLSKERTISGFVNNVAKRYFVQQGKYGPDAEDPILPDELTKGLKLKIGDKVVCNVKTLGRIDVVSEIISVNDDIPKLDPIDIFTHTDVEKPYVSVDFASGKDDSLGTVLNKLTSFCLGQRLMFATVDGYDLSSALFFTRSRLTNSRINKKTTAYSVSFSKNATDEDNVYCLFGKTDDVKFSTYNFVVSKIKQDFCDGKEVVLFIDDLNELCGLFANFSEKAKIGTVNIDALSMLQDILILPRQSRKNGSISLIFAVDFSETDMAMKELLTKYADAMVFGNTTLKNFGVYPPVDILKSGSKRGAYNELVAKLRKNIRKGNFLIETENAIKTLLE